MSGRFDLFCPGLSADRTGVGLFTVLCTRRFFGHLSAVPAVFLHRNLSCRVLLHFITHAAVDALTSGFGTRRFPIYGIFLIPDMSGRFDLFYPGLSADRTGVGLFTVLCTRRFFGHLSAVPAVFLHRNLSCRVLLHFITHAAVDALASSFGTRRFPICCIFLIPCMRHRQIIQPGSCNDLSFKNCRNRISQYPFMTFQHFRLAVTSDIIPGI